MVGNLEGRSYEQLTPAPDFSRLRKPGDPVQARLLVVTAQWILTLPLQVRPLALSRRFPRVANQLAKAWDEPAIFEARLDEYLGCDRPVRKGFPADVCADLLKLKNYFQQVRKAAAHDALAADPAD